MQLNSSSNFTFDKTLYRSKFVDYCIITNNRVGKNIVFLYGKNPLGKQVYLILLHPVGYMHDLFQQGMILTKHNLISTGVVNQSSLHLSVEEKTKDLFTIANSNMAIGARTPTSCLTQFSYFNSSGELFHIEYKITVLNSVSVDQVNGTQLFYMTLQ